MGNYEVKKPLLETPIEHYPYAFIQEPGGRAVHVAAAHDLRPLCTCPCTSPTQPKRAGDTLCRCPCHQKGPKYTPSLCGRLPVRSWTVLSATTRLGRLRKVCQTCHALSCAGPPVPPPPPPPTCGLAFGLVRPVRGKLPVCKLEKGHAGSHVGHAIGADGSTKGVIRWRADASVNPSNPASAMMDKIRKLRALGASTNPHEALSAMQTAKRLMSLHRITEEDLHER